MDFSTNSIEGFSVRGLKSFQVFLDRFGTIDGSYLNVKIFVIEEGSLVQNGTHEELINQAGAYQKLATLQFKE